MQEFRGQSQFSRGLYFDLCSAHLLIVLSGKEITQSKALKQVGLNDGTDHQVLFEKIGVNRLSRDQCLFFQINLLFVRKYVYS